MLIVLEGPDCAGKSTLAQQIVECLGPNTVVWKKGPPEHTAMREYVFPLSKLVRRSAPYVLDRWHVGELIYGPLLRGKSILSPGQAAYVELVLTTLGATFVHVTARYETILERLIQRGDDLIATDHLSTIMEQYDRYTAGRDYWYRLMTDEPYDVRELTNFAAMHRPSLPSNLQYIGPARPDLLLLGDKRNDSSYWAQHLLWPFGPDTGTSGLWLFNAFVRAGVNVQRLGFVNACELSPAALRSTWIELGQPPVVALGNNARAAAATAALEYAQVPHPQYMRRFKHYEADEYVQDIISVIPLMRRAA